MTDRELSPTDRALRERLTELCVHIPCGGLRGPLQKRSRFHPELPVRWQSCQDEDAPEKWDNEDVSRQFELCIVCFRATAGGTSRWSWLACQECRAINESLGQRWGFRPFALGRHSVMNGIAVRGGSSPEVQAAQMERLVEFGKGDHDLRDWRRREYTRLASKFGPLADVPLKTWQHEWTPGKEASQDAFARLLGD
jgi:hypothetical protein